jgi:hypothetical protein
VLWQNAAPCWAAWPSSAILSAPASPRDGAGRRSAGSAWAGRRNERRHRRPKPADDRAQGATLAELARGYGVGKSTISRL